MFILKNHITDLAAGDRSNAYTLSIGSNNLKMMNLFNSSMYALRSPTVYASNMMLANPNIAIRLDPEQIGMEKLMRWSGS